MALIRDGRRQKSIGSRLIDYQKTLFYVTDIFSERIEIID